LRVAVRGALPAIYSVAPVRFAALWTAFYTSLALVESFSAFAPETNRAFSSLVSASLFHKSLWFRA
jgi:hypothetical protein